MAKNRTEVKTEVTSALVATLTLALHKTLLNDEILQNILFRKDVKTTVSGIGGGAKAVDFEPGGVPSDFIQVTGVNGNITITFSNLSDGDVNYLLVSKNAGNTIAFVATINTSPYQYEIDVNATSVLYRITNKNGQIYAEAIYKPSGAFTTLALINGWTGGSVKYRILDFGKVEVKIEDLDGSAATNNAFAALPSKAYPSNFTGFSVNADLAFFVAGGLVSSINGILQLDRTDLPGLGLIEANFLLNTSTP